MTAKSFKRASFGIIALTLCGWLVSISAFHATVEGQIKLETEERERQLRIIASHEKLDQRDRSIRDREERERRICECALSFTHSYELNRRLCESFEMPSDGFALFSRTESGSGFLLRSEEDADVVAYVRKLPPAAHGVVTPRGATLLQQTLESPDRRIVLPVKLHQLMAYQVETSGPPDELELGLRLTGRDFDQFIPFYKVEDAYQFAGSDGPYNGGIFKNREHEVTYGAPDLADVDFIKILQKRGIWLLACNEIFRSAQRSSDQSPGVHVVLVMTSEDPWRVHPDYSYCRDLESAFSLQWDPQQENYLTKPLP